MVTSGLFVLLLQLVGINLTATMLFRVFGLSTRGSRYGRGKQWVFAATLAVTVAALIGLLTWQLSQPPEFQRSTRAQRAAAEIGQVIAASGTTKLVETNVRFTRSEIEGQNTLLGVVYVQRQPGVTASTEEISDTLTRAIQTRLLAQGFNVTPLIDVNVLAAPNKS